jgi:hypothetical protein
METPENLVSAGWQESDQGVFTRRCQDNCRRPVLYGGGVADVMEVNCLERPCGVIQALEFADELGISTSFNPFKLHDIKGG